jgi:hypothetical protein
MCVTILSLVILFILGKLGYTSFSTLKPIDEGRLQLLEKGILKIGAGFQITPLGDEVKNTLAILKVRWSLAVCHLLFSF